MTHQCTVCLKHFDFVSKLRRHQLTHSGQRPFTCYICLKSFLQSAHLKGHLKSHSKLRKVSLIVSRTIHSQISFTGTEGGYGRHAGAELGDESLWYGSLQTSNESGFGKQNHGLNEQNHGKLQISDNGQMCEFVQGSYDGYGDMPHEESFQNGQYSECPTILPNSATTGSCVEQQEHLGAIYVTEDTQKPGSCIEEQTAQVSARHQCSVCLKCFSAPSKLKRHVLIHGSLRPFCCEFCPKAFRQLTHLKVHLSTHFSQRLKQAKEVIPVNAGSQNPQTHPLDTANTPEYRSKPSKRLWTEEAGELGKELNGSENVHTEPFPEHVKRVKGLNTAAAEDRTRSKIMHECPVCRKCFSAPSKLRRHCLIHTGQRPFQCSLCSRAFRQLSHLKAHHSVHTAPRKTLTSSLQPQPGTSRTSKARLKRFVHISLARKLKAVKQKLKISSALSSLSPAAKVMNNENISEADVIRSSPDQEISRRQDYSCSVCSKHFSAPSKLRRHLLIHTGQRPFRCSLCFRGFRQKSHLQVHKCKGESRDTLQSSISEVHLRDPARSRSAVSIRQGDEVGKENFISSCGIGDRYDCSPSAGHASDSVPEDSKDLASLPYEAISRPLDEANQAKDSGYQCTICFKIFDFPSKLSRHLLIHMNVKPFKCSICSKSFRQLCHLQSHSKVHMGGKSLICQGTYKSEMETFIPETSETFSETNNCSKESEKLPAAERPDLSCDHQNMNPANTSSLSCSMNIEEFTPSTVSTSSLLEVHKGEESSSQMKRNANQCIFCLKTFDFPSKLSRHLLVHTGIRPYKCHVCYKSFKQLSHLQCHQWVHNRKDKSELEASISFISSDGTSLTDDLDLHQESSESLAMINQGHDGYTVQVHQQKWISEDNNCCSSDSGQGESKVKSETNLLVDKSHNSDPFDSDSTSSAVFYKCLDQQTEKLENKDYKHCLNITGEVFPSAADRTTRIPVWNSMDQQESFETRDPAPLAHKIERTNQHLVEPPNDLPICPSCSQCFDSLQKLNTHNCPVHCAKQRLSKSYQCAVCFKSFEAPSKLKRHYVIHTGQRPYRCNMCEKDFTQSSHLKTHMMSHR
ncbi:zinc finger protein 770 [Hemibagrus wyckioides]|nr:zinc finger protein 770 [Hemibagrus wyckioides]XP_058234775.1 zinc finger protein 770 [Hemibagrus wyckioides]